MRMVRRLPAYLLALLLFAAAQHPLLRAQNERYDGLPVRNIQFDPADQPLEAAELHDILPLKIGQPLSMSVVRAAIDRLFATGRYTDIQVDAQPYQTGVLIRFITTNRWFIGATHAAGNISSPPNSGQIENAAQLDLGTPYTDAKIAEAQAGQLRLLENNGLFRANVHPIFDWETGRDYQQVNIRFEVDSGPRARFATPVLAGDIKMDAERILRASKFRRWIIHTWKPMTQTRLRQGLNGIRSLYIKDNRLEAKVSLDGIQYDAETDQAVPSLRIDAGPRIEVHTIGAKVSRGKLERYIPIYQEHSVDDDLLREGSRNLRDYFQSEGFSDAEVEYKQQRVINDRAAIDYLVNLGKRHRLVAIFVEGNRYFSTAAIRERMFLRTVTFIQFPHGRYSENLLTRDIDAISTLYKTNGFRDVRVTARIQDDYLGRIGDLAVTIQVVEGPQYFIQTLQVNGIEHLDKTAVVAQLSSGEGQPFSEFNVAVDRDAILARYFEKGFANATFEWSSKPSPADPHRVLLSYLVHEGNEQFVRQVVYSGNRVTRASLINHVLEMNPGDPLSPTQITDTQRRLYNLGVFAKVDAAIQDPDGETDRKYVLYDLDEARRYSFALGFGAEFARIGNPCAECLDAPGGETGFSPRVSLDVTRNNLWGIGHSISLRSRVSSIQQQALLTYSWPRFEGNDKLSLAITGLYQDSRDVRTFSYKRDEGSIQLSQRASKATTVLYRYTYRRVGVSELKITPFLVPLLSQPVRLGSLSGGVVQDHRDDPVDPHKGYYTTLDLSLAEHAFGSQRNFLRFLGRNASYYQIGKRFVFARSTEFGDMYAFNYSGNALDAIPLAERFFAGGGNSNRGFPEFQSGPRDTETGFPIGGTALFFNQTELRFPLIGENIGGVLFHDMGNTFSSLSNLSFRVKQRSLQDFDYMVHAVGFGVRYRTPVGPLRVDLAYSINPPRFFGFKGTETDLINAGVNPCAAAQNQCTQTGVSHFQFFFSIGQTF
ncbi:MAG TPA: POTRA domain-containing protein [Candidatus Limnocylindrales bacterium]|nr:POTRA domain-containing protein [Candidatus Limnocylindrales bacterium]